MIILCHKLGLVITMSCAHVKVSNIGLGTMIIHTCVHNIYTHNDNDNDTTVVCL